MTTPSILLRKDLGAEGLLAPRKIIQITLSTTSENEIIMSEFTEKNTKMMQKFQMCNTPGYSESPLRLYFRQSLFIAMP